MNPKHEFRVEIDGVVVWSGSFDDDSIKHFPRELIERPADPEPGEKYPTPVHLFIDDELIGVQICQAQETAIAAHHAATTGGN